MCAALSQYISSFPLECVHAASSSVSFRAVRPHFAEMAKSRDYSTLQNSYGNSSLDSKGRFRRDYVIFGLRNVPPLSYSKSDKVLEPNNESPFLLDQWQTDESDMAKKADSVIAEVEMGQVDTYVSSRSVGSAGSPAGTPGPVRQNAVLGL